MSIVISLIIGTLIGAGVMFFVNKNNKDRFEAVSKKLDQYEQKAKNAVNEIKK